MHVNPLAIQEDLAVEKRTQALCAAGSPSAATRRSLSHRRILDGNVWGQPYSWQIRLNVSPLGQRSPASISRCSLTVMPRRHAT